MIHGGVLDQRDSDEFPSCTEAHVYMSVPVWKAGGVETHEYERHADGDWYLRVRPESWVRQVPPEPSDIQHRRASKTWVTEGLARVTCTCAAAFDGMTMGNARRSHNEHVQASARDRRGWKRKYVGGPESSGKRLIDEPGWHVE